MRDETVGTIRTTYNGTLLVFIILVLNSLFEWNLTLEELIPYTPIIMGVIAVFYRASLVLCDIWPPLGYILFGHKKTPVYNVEGIPGDY